MGQVTFPGTLGFLRQGQALLSPGLPWWPGVSASLSTGTPATAPGNSPFQPLLAPILSKP